MKQAIPLLVIFLYMLFTPGFQCGRPEVACNEFTSDTTLMRLQVLNSTPLYHINDTIRLFSGVSDTIRTVKGEVFNYSLSSLKMSLNAYKVVRNSSNVPELNYANNEFNVLVENGNFENTGGTGFQFLFRRFEPINTLNVSLLPGRQGLYLIEVNHYNYSYSYGLNFYRENERCKSYTGVSNITIAEQQRQYWDTIGTTTLRLSNANYELINKNNRNYFFVRVLP